MRLLEYILPQRPRTASVAKERLMLVLAHEHAGSEGSEFLPALRNDLIAIVRKYVAAKDDAIEVKLGHQGKAAVLEISIELPGKSGRRAHAN
ncbi:MAG TPA: cell division topological specificity factor MinE [Stellaceae bacterium]|nr:cell division topological specificity factor MinE [Stellaceae bacterium]